MIVLVQVFEREPGFPPRERPESEPVDVTPEHAVSYDRPAIPTDVYRDTGTVRSGVTTYSAEYDPRAERIVWLITAVIDILLAMRFIFMLLGASPRAAFTSLLYGITLPLVAPFQGMFPNPGQGVSIFEPASVVAMIVYTLIGWVIVAVIRIRHSRRRPPP